MEIELQKTREALKIGSIVSGLQKAMNSVVCRKRGYNAGLARSEIN